MVFLLGKLLWLLAVFSHGMLREHGGQAAIAAIVLVKIIRCIRYGAKELRFSGYNIENLIIEIFVVS